MSKQQSDAVKLFDRSTPKNQWVLYVFKQHSNTIKLLVRSILAKTIVFVCAFKHKNSTLRGAIKTSMGYEKLNSLSLGVGVKTPQKITPSF